MGHHQMDARRFHVGERANGVFQFSLQRALIVDLFVELRSHPVGLVEDLKAEPPALHAFRGGQQPRFIQLRGGHHDAAAVGGGLKRYLRLRENLTGLTPILRVHIRVKHAPVGSQTIPEQASNERHKQHSRHQHPAALRRPHPGPADLCPAPETGQPVGQLRLPNHQGRAFL